MSILEKLIVSTVPELPMKNSACMKSTLCLPADVWANIHGLMQARRNSIANALELCLSCTNLSM